jgi:hypothetical protein
MICCKCKTDKPLSAFYRTKERLKNGNLKNGGYRYDCKQCVLTSLKEKYIKRTKKAVKARQRYRKQYAKKNKDKLLAQKRDYYHNRGGSRRRKERNIRKRYGISLEQYENIKARQDYKCAICGIPDAECYNGLHLDHNHRTGQIRGFLCLGCNHAIGKMGDNPTLLYKAAEYLEKYQQIILLSKYNPEPKDKKTSKRKESK